MCMKFQKILMTGCRDMDKKHQKCPKNGGFPHLWPPKIFFQKSGSVTFVPLWCPNFMQKIRKNQWAVSEIFTDGPRTDQRTNGQGRLLRTPSGKPWAQKGLLFMVMMLTYLCSHWPITTTLIAWITRWRHLMVIHQWPAFSISLVTESY